MVVSTPQDYCLKTTVCPSAASVNALNYAHIVRITCTQGQSAPAPVRAYAGSYFAWRRRTVYCFSAYHVEFYGNAASGNPLRAANPKKIPRLRTRRNPDARIKVHRLIPLYFTRKLSTIVAMNIELRFGANEGGQQPSEMKYPVNRQTPRPHMLPIGQIFEEIPRETSENYTKSNRNWLTNRSYRKQTIKPCLTGTRTALWNTEFWPGGARLAAPQRMISGPSRGRQPVTEASREVVNCVALLQGNIQNLCGTIIFSAIVRPHGISSVV
jgi:hypothetical protein